jgi:hypothetical protein
MRQTLKVHPDLLCSTVTHIEVEVMRPCAGSLLLSYLVTGRISDLRIPPAVAAARTDDLWRHTCFEALAAVIDETSGHKSYWALAHPPGKADFHHSDCFALEFF